MQTRSTRDLKHLSTPLLVWVAIAYPILLASNTISPFPEPLTPKNPLGSLIYDSSTSGTIAAAGDVRSFTLPINATQTITLDVRPVTTLQPTVTVLDPGGNVIGSVTASAAGAEAVLQTVPASTKGTYTFSVSGSGGTTGDFTIEVTLNAMLDSSAHGGSENSTLATAQDLASSALPLAGAADRLAVLGHFDGTPDVYSFTLQNGQSVTLALTLATNSSLGLQLDDSLGNVVAVATAGATDVTLAIENFVTPVAGTYYAVVVGPGQSDYSLIVTRGADFDMEPNDDALHAQNLNSADVILGAIGNGANSIDQDWYAFNVVAHQTITVLTATPSDQGGEFHNHLFPQIDLYDSNVVNVATSAGAPKNAPVIWTALSAGTYFARVSGAASSTGEYVFTEMLTQGPDVMITKTAAPNPVIAGSNVTYALNVANIGTSSASNVVVTDNLPSGTTFVSCFATGGGICGGAGNNRTITFSSLAAPASAQITLVALVNCSVSDAAKISNTATVTATLDVNPNNNSASASVTVANPTPSFSKAFNPKIVTVNQASTLTFTLTNPSALTAATGVALMDTLPPGLSGSLLGLNGCGGAQFAINGSTISLSNATIPPGGTCTAQVTVTANAPGAYTNVSGAVMSGPCTGGTASATLTVAQPPTISKAFVDSMLQLMGPSNSTNLSFTLTNPAANPIPLTGLAFTDTLPSGLIVSTPNGQTGSCGGGTITAIAGSNSISLSAATLASGASCTFSVNVTAMQIGVQTNTTSTVTSNEAPPGAPATASTSVDDLFFLWFFL